MEAATKKTAITAAVGTVAALGLYLTTRTAPPPVPVDRPAPSVAPTTSAREQAEYALHPPQGKPLPAPPIPPASVHLAGPK